MTKFNSCPARDEALRERFPAFDEFAASCLHVQIVELRYFEICARDLFVIRHANFSVLFELPLGNYFQSDY